MECNLIKVELKLSVALPSACPEEPAGSRVQNHCGLTRRSFEDVLETIWP